MILFLQKLGHSCLDSKHKELIEELQTSLTILTGAIERATVAAEKLGAVHQVTVLVEDSVMGTLF